MVVSANKFLSKSEQKENAQYIMTYLLKKGWTKNAIAGMLGNMETESTINPGIWQSLRTNWYNGGFGLVQWTPATKYLDWAKARGLDYRKMDTNLKRILYEVDKNIQWINRNMTFKEFTKSKKSPYELGLLFLKHYERPANPNQPNRGTQAEYWYRTLSGTDNPVPLPEPEPEITEPKPAPKPPPIEIVVPEPVIPPPAPVIPTEPTTKPAENHKPASFSFKRDMLTVNNEFMVHPFTCQEKQVLNAERTIELSVVKTANNTEAFHALENEAELQLGDEEYVIKEKQGFMVGKNPAKKIYGLHIFFSIIEGREDDELSGTLALSDVLSFTLNNSGWGYEIYGDNPKLRKENFGNDNKLSLFNSILKDWDVEYKLDTPNRMVKIYPRIGELVDHTFRYNQNIKSLKLTQDTRELRTAIKGYGKAETITVGDKEVTTQLVAEYISPNAAKFGLRWADPIRDERFTIKGNLEEYLKETLQDEPIFSVETDVSQVDEEYDPSLGDSVLTIHEPLELDIDTRITEITRFPFDKTKRTQVVISNISPEEARKVSDHYIQLAILKKSNATLLKQYKKVEETTTANTQKIEENKKATDEKTAQLETAIEDSKVWVNIKDYGATGKAEQDATAAFQKAVDYINSKGGGTLYIPDTDEYYWFKSYVKLCSNLTIKSNGAVLKKTKGSLNYYIFVGLSGKKKGYGSGPSNIIFDGVRIEGSFAGNRGASITLHHSQNVQVMNCTFNQSVISGHGLDLGGCSDVSVTNCWFFGQKITSQREYAEAIQIDHSTGEGNGLIDDPASYDGLPCRNVTVDNCKFLPLTVDGITYPAPNPLGSHSRVMGKVFTNIKFNNNLVEDGMIIPTDSLYAHGWLHFYHIDGLEIKNNEFINKNGRDSRIIGLYSIDTAISMDDVALLEPIKKAYTPVPAKNVTIKDNKIKGFNNTNNARLIYIQGRTVGSSNYYADNIKVLENDFIDCYGGSGNAMNTSSDLVYADKVINLRVAGNTGSDIKRLLYAIDSKKITTSENTLNNAHWVPFLVENSNDVSHLNNKLDGCGIAFYSNGVDIISVKGNTVVNEFDEIQPSYGDMIAFKTCKRISAKDNTLSGKSGSPFKSINVYSASDTGKISDNFITGFGAPVVSADSTNIVVS